MAEVRINTYHNMLIACAVLAVAQAAHFYIYFEQTFWLSVKWSVKGSTIWFFIFALTIQLLRSERLTSNNKFTEITCWVTLIIFCGAVQVFIAIAIDALLGTASRPILDDFLHLYSKRWLQNSLIFGVFIMWWRFWQTKTLSSQAPLLEQKRLKVSDGTQTHWLIIDDISHLESLGNYVCIYALDTKHVVRNTLKALAAELVEYNFLQVSRSAIVNLNFVRSYTKPGPNKVELTLRNNHSVAVGRTYWKNVKASLELQQKITNVHPK